MVIERLMECGYTDVSENPVIKNGVRKNGITIRNNSNIAPVIYLDDIMEKYDDIDSIVDIIINIYESHKSIDVDVEQLTSKEWILNHVFIALQKTSNETELIKKNTEFDGIEQYLYLRDTTSNHEGYSIKVNNSIMNSAEISLESLWTAAEKNTFAAGETTIESMASVLSAMGCPIDDDIPLGIPGMYVVSNSVREKGASAILDTEALRKFGEENDIHRAVVIFSSRHETLLITVPDEDINLENLDDYDRLCNEVNTSGVVDEVDMLPSKCYILRF